MSAPIDPGTPLPGPRHPWLPRFARAMLGAFGWHVRFDGLPGPKGIAIVYPHTSNWDFVIGLLAKWALDLPIRWVGKESLFRGVTGATLGRLMRLWGGRPVDRHQASGAVEQLVQLMQSEPWFWLGLAPEGTRKHSDRLRSGFYRLALKLDLPVALAYIDYATREVGVCDFVHMSGDVERDLDMLRSFYAGKTGRFPDKASDIAFKLKDDALRRLPSMLICRRAPRTPEAGVPNQSTANTRATATRSRTSGV